MLLVREITFLGRHETLLLHLLLITATQPIRDQSNDLPMSY